MWDDVRIGGSMNFMREPDHRILPNSEMKEEELAVATAFVDELMALGVLREPLTSTGEPMDIANAPLFTVPKPGQPGQYRCIADMLKGGQNEVVASDPVVLCRAPHILDEMYYGGWSAVFDLSKYFYNYNTREEDRPYLGMIHPTTHAILAYYGLPMGAGNSPVSLAVVARLSSVWCEKPARFSKALLLLTAGGPDSFLNMMAMTHERGLATPLPTNKVWPSVCTYLLMTSSSTPPQNVSATKPSCFSWTWLIDLVSFAILQNALLSVRPLPSSVSSLTQRATLPSKSAP
jgi:hypothetical protein